MVSKDCIKSGLLKYIDLEIIPNLPSTGKWISGAAIVLASANFDSMYSKFIDNSAIKMLGICQDQYLDIDKLSAAFKESANKYGKLKLSFPFIGAMYFSADDIEKLVQYIKTES